ncbi:hypothetical protein M9Y10_031067 [Tritrichomonas musculus]|uniref:KilA-N domain-containing protein n=1 Tax=Tritrichomonas musculus TaxID=1915356 RepID=A0ABR2H1P6_9EUKA
MQSIINSCHSNKLCKDWFRNQSTQELLNEMEGRGIPPPSKRMNLSPGLQGYYVHKYLVNSIAMWASPRYSYYIMKLLDDYFNQQRNQLQIQINNLSNRTVPNNREHDYKYLIWLEQIPNDNANVKLHLIRRHKDYFNSVRSHYDDLNERWFFKENLPISMSCNNDIKNIIRENFDETEANINGNVVTINREILDDLQK